MKLKVEQSERQELSAYIAEIGKSADAEPDLDRRVDIFEEACRRYPAEVQFQQSLRLTREQRDLVHSISAKARQYEEQSQFADAIGQWKILRNIHPQYPGIEVEIGQLEKRREQQIQEEKKARFVEQIDRAIDSPSYAKALQLAIEALAEFPQDSELIVLERIARQGLERTQEAERLFEEARQTRAAGQLEDATALLQHAFKLDQRNLGMRNALVSLLVERAHSLLDQDWRTAEPLAEDAFALDEQHPAVKRLRTLIAEAKRKDCVGQCVAEVRELQRSGDVPAALNRLADGLALYPDEPRLLQCQAGLQNSVQQRRKEQTFPVNNESRVAEAHKGAPVAAAPTAPQSPVTAPLETGFTSIYQPSEVNANSIPNSIGATVVSIPQPDAVKPGTASAETITETVPSKPRFSGLALQLQALGAAAAAAISRVKRHAATVRLPKLRPGPKLWAVSLGALVLLCLIAGVFLMRRNPPPPAPLKRLIPSKVDVPVTVVPDGATLSLGGTVQSERTLHLETGKTYTAVISKVGYKPLTRSALIAEQGGWKFVLEPEPVHIQLLTSERSGKVLLDGNEIWNLEQGDMMDFQFPANSGQHTLTAANHTGELFNVKFMTADGQSPRIAPLDTRGLIAAGSLGNEASIVSGNRAKSWLNLPGKAPVELSPEGTTIRFDATDVDQTVLTISDVKKHQSVLVGHGNAPALLIALNANPNVGTATITTPVESAKLLLDGRERKARKPGYWHVSATPGAHQIRLVADGYADGNRTIQIGKGQDTNQAIEMTPASATFSIEGGIAGAEILIDNSSVGSLDSSGSIHTAVAPGPHQISVRKAGFEGLSLQRKFEAGRALTVMGRDIVLRPFGTLNLAVEPAGATVQYRRADEAEWHAAATGPLKVKAGIYEVSGAAVGYESANMQINLGAGEVAQASLHLPALATPKPPAADRLTKDFFVHPEELQAQYRDWYTGKSNRFLELKPANRYVFTFLAPDMMPTKHKPKGFEWRINVGSEAEIVYELDAQQLTRRIKAGLRSDKMTTGVNASDGHSAYSLVITFEPHGLKIAKRDGTVVDSLSNGRYDWSRATMAIKGDAFFVVR